MLLLYTVSGADKTTYFWDQDIEDQLDLICGTIPGWEIFQEP